MESLNQINSNSKRNAIINFENEERVLVSNSTVNLRIPIIKPEINENKGLILWSLGISKSMTFKDYIDKKNIKSTD